MRFHTSLPVRDIEATSRFYSVLFDAKPAKSKPDYVKFLPETGGLNVSFHEGESGAGPLKELHLGFEMPDQKSLDRAHERLSAAGFVSTSRETSVCCYANQDKFWVTDPDGYMWEFYVLLEDTEQKMEAQTSCCAGGACC